MINNHEPGQFPAPGEVRLTRLLPGPIERVWEYLTDPAKRKKWFTDGPMELRPGGAMRLHFRHANISPGETPPPDYKQYHDPGEHMDGKVLRCEPPRVLSFTFGDEADVTFELTPQGQQVLLVLTHRSRGSDIANTGDYASGWHTHLAMLVPLLEGKSPPLFWATHASIKPLYVKSTPAKS
jgi:uncharacterized protein YndB with AHSA1/START domain